MLGRNFMVFLFFLFMSAFFWFLQTMNENLTAEVDFAVEWQNIPENVVLISDLPNKLRVSVNEKGVDLLTMYVGKRKPLKLNFNDYSEMSECIRLNHSDLQKLVTSQLLPGSRITGIHPDSMEIFYNFGIKKKVPVIWDGTIETKPQYCVSDIRFERDSVWVYAADLYADSIVAAHTRPQQLTDLSENYPFDVEFKSVRGAKFVPSHIAGEVRVEMFTEKTVEVPVRGRNFPASKQLRTFPARVKVLFQVPLSQFRQVDTEDFVISISYEDLLKQSNNRCHLELRSLPHGVSHVRIEPESVDFLIEDISDDEE
jgi:hypothetical protein